MNRSFAFAVPVCILLAAMAGGPAIAEDAIERVLAATFRITDKKTSGTAFLVWPEGSEEAAGKRPILVTAAHALERFEGAVCTLMLRVKNEDSTYSRRETDVAIRDGDKPLWVRHPELDIAALAIDLPEGTAASPLRFEQLADQSWAAERKLRVGSEVFIPGYPATLEANEAGWPVLRRGTMATHPVTPIANAQRVLVHANTFGGDSGAPVVQLADNEAVVVGMVVGMQRQTDRTTMSFEERTFHMPLALAIVVQAPLVRETVELLKKAAAQDGR
ncbi:MAG: serine protease [Thermoguttaceae bacterium]|jgi:hypothetical protein|nr:serine protease [Thermoguttaceae bacterium]